MVAKELFCWCAVLSTLGGDSGIAPPANPFQYKQGLRLQAGSVKGVWCEWLFFNMEACRRRWFAFFKPRAPRAFTPSKGKMQFCPYKYRVKTPTSPIFMHVPTPGKLLFWVGKASGARQPRRTNLLSVQLSWGDCEALSSWGKKKKLFL